MSARKKTPTVADDTIPLRLHEARNDLLLAQLRLASIEGDVAFEDLLFVRRLIGVACEQMKALHRNMLH